MGLGKDVIDEEQIGVETRRTIELIVIRLKELLDGKRVRITIEVEDKPPKTP